MSSFPGRMKEYPVISIDRFDKENLHARAYFLSHCHKDHMKGLKARRLKRKLKVCLTVKLYCSFVSKELLLSNPKYSFWEDHIIALELDSPTHISLIDEVTGESEDVVVTLLPAGHCPGSVMFLFEGQQGTVLYTGDFRLATGDTARMEHLHSGDQVKDIKSVYLDTTFYDPRFYQIPSREACLNGVRALVQDWICQSPYHVVWLNCKAAYGYEYLFINLGQEFTSQIHVNSLDMYKKMPEILCHVTTDKRTQIHACRHPKDDEFFRANRLPCGSTAPDGTPLRIISIKPSTMWFGERTRKTNVIVRMGGSSYRACFSFHSSYSEIKDFLHYICPLNIYPSVLPLGRTLEEVTELLKPMCRKPSETHEVVYKPLGLLKRARMRHMSRDSDSDEDLFGDVAVAPMRKKLATIEVKEHHKLENVVPNDAPVLIIPEAVSTLQTSNYMDCTESNDDDDDEEDDEDNNNKELLNQSQSTSNASPASSRLESDTPSSKLTAPILDSVPPPLNQATPTWNTFFTAEPVVTDESCEPDNSQSSPNFSYYHTSSQSPELFHDDNDGDNDESVHISSSQSTHISDAGTESLSQNDTELTRYTRPDQTLAEQMNASENGSHKQDETGTTLNDVRPLNVYPNVLPVGRTVEEITQLPAETGPTLSDNHQSNQAEEATFTEKSEAISDSQVSSDFDLPQTPGSKTPHPDELKDLYKKLAAGEDINIRRDQQRCV